MKNLPKKKNKKRKAIKTFKVKKTQVKKSKFSRKAPGGSSFQLKAYHILPDFNDTENLVRFSALLYIIALLPIIGYLYQPKVAKVAVTPKVAETYVVRRQVKKAPSNVVKGSSSVLGSVFKPLATPRFPSWKVQYFAGQLMISPVAEKVEVLHPISLGLDQLQPFPTLDMDDFSARFESMVGFESGIYRFTGNEEGKYKVYIDGGLILDSMQESSQDTYVGGGAHKVRVDYHSRSWFAPFNLDWSRQE